MLASEQCCHYHADMALIRLSGQKVRERREALGISQLQLSRDTELGRVTLWKIESEGYQHGCQKWVAKALAEALGTTVEALQP
jgi:DNA-binding XRE family transcriptional regulator